MENRFFPNYPNYRITSRFGMRTHPVTKKPSTMHKGIDLVAYDGKSSHTDYITAHTGGTVESVGYNSSSGYYVNIRVSDRSVMSYYHMSKLPNFKKGATVKKGDRLGYMGSTGTATAAHLHWGIKQDGKWIDPEPYLDKDFTEEERTVTVKMKVLRKGARGEQVEALQALLIGYGYNCGPDGVDGSLGSATERALKQYQSDSELDTDGVCGPATWGSLLRQN